MRICFTVFLLLGSLSTALAETDSTWTATGDGDWFDTTNWSGAVPNGAGDIATLRSGGRFFVSVTLDAPTTLGQLVIPDRTTSILTGTAPFFFDNPGEEAAVLSLGSGRDDYSLPMPIGIADGEQLNIDVASTSILTLSGGRTAGNGGIVKKGNGSLVLSEASPDWNGSLTIDGGTVTVRDTESLGSAVGGVRINASARLQLISDVTLEKPLQFDGGLLEGWGARNPVINGPIELLSSGRIQNVNTGDRFTLNGPITGPGGITYERGKFDISGDSTYEGITVVKPGQVLVRHANGLGSPNQGTIVEPFGELRLFQSTLEPITLRGGEIQFVQDATSAGTITLESGTLDLPRDATFTSPFLLANTGDNPIVRGDRTTFTGGVTGEGDLWLQGQGHLTVDQQPLAHDGSLIANSGNTSDRITLNAANSYTGDTIVKSGQLIVNHEEALGTSESPIKVQTRGRLVLNVPTTRALDIAGVLEIGSPDIELNQTISLRWAPELSSNPTPAIYGQGTFNGEIHLLDNEFSRPLLRGGTFNGVISGEVKTMTLSANDTVFLNADNTYRGVTTISSSEGSKLVEANSSRSLGDTDQGSLVTYGTLNVNVPMEESLVVINRGRVNLNAQQSRLPRLFFTDAHLRPGIQAVAINTPSQYDEWVDVIEGDFEINADTTLWGATVRNGGEIRVADGSLLQLLSDDLTLQSGKIEGRIRGAQTLRKVTSNRAELGYLAGFDGEIVIEQGTLQIATEGALGSSRGTTRVAEKNAVLQIFARGSLTFREDIFLNNATGTDHKGGLFVYGPSNPSPRLRLEGRLDLGSKGSILGGGVVELAGPVTGGSLTIQGSLLRFLNDDSSFTGPTNIREGTIELRDNGRLTTTSAIVLSEGLDYADATLLLNNTDTVIEDRVADNIPLLFHGGSLDSWGPLNETVGRVALLEGDSSINLQPGSQQRTIEKRLYLASLTRQTGATVRVEVSEVGQVHINEPPPMIGGILPWVIAANHHPTRNREDSFGTVSEQGIVPFSDYASNINQASAFDNVRASGNVTLTNDRVINSLTLPQSFDDSLDLGGNQLTINSGGVRLGSRIRNGKITAGAGGHFELLLYDGHFEADIVDNGRQSVDVTTVGGTTFSGNNTYTGTTYVNENALVFATEASLPDGADLEIVGGEATIGYNSTNPKHLGRVRIAGGGSFTHSSFRSGVFSFDEILLEDGDWRRGQLVGSGKITKSTIGSSTIWTDNGSTYSGGVVVEDGALFVRTELPEAVYTVQGGSLHLPFGRNAVELAGGDLYLTNKLSGNLLISADSRIATKEFSSLIALNAELSGVLTGTGNLTLGSQIRLDDDEHMIEFTGKSPEYSGDVEIDSVSVNIRHENSLGTGEIAILPDGLLRFAPRFGNSLQLPNNVYLKGGEIRGYDTSYSLVQLLGDLFVAGRSSIREMNVVGTTHLADGSTLTAHGEGVTQFLGDIKVGGRAELEYGLTRIVSNATDIDVGTIQLLGTIASDADHAVLDLIDRGLDEIAWGASFYVAEGQTLQVLQNGEPLALTIDNAGKSLSGNGKLINDVALRNGSAVSPGNSAGELIVDGDVIVDGGAIYEWEIADAAGVAGTDWDLWRVEGELAFEATSSNPWVLRISDLPGLHSLDGNSWLIATAEVIQGFDPAALQIDVSGIDSTSPLYTVERFVVFTDGNNLVLQSIPEPGTSLMLFIAIVFSTGKRRTRKS